MGSVGAAVLLRLLAQHPLRALRLRDGGAGYVEAWRVSLQARPAPEDAILHEPTLPGAPPACANLVQRMDENAGSQRYLTMNSIVPAEVLRAGDHPAGRGEEVGPARVPNLWQRSNRRGRPRSTRTTTGSRLHCRCASAATESWAAGRGGMGVVYLARDDALEREVAIKMLSTYSGDDSAKARFLVEARAVAKLNHPNIISIFDVGEENGRPYFAMPLVQGKPLKTGDPWPLATAAALVEKVARAISYAEQAAASFTAISSPPTSCSTTAGNPWSWTSA